MDDLRRRQLGHSLPAAAARRAAYPVLPTSYRSVAEIEEEARTALARCPEMFERRNVIDALDDEPDRSTLDRGLRDLSREGALAVSTVGAGGAARDTGEAPDLIPVAGSHNPAAAGATTVRSEAGSVASEVWQEPAGIVLAVNFVPQELSGMIPGACFVCQERSGMFPAGPGMSAIKAGIIPAGSGVIPAATGAPQPAAWSDPAKLTLP